MEWLILIVIVALILIALQVGKLDTSSYRLRGALFTPAERTFYISLQHAVHDKYVVLAKVRVADVIAPQKGLSRKNWQIAFNRIAAKHFDFVLCRKDNLQVVAAVELFDERHASQWRRSQKTDITISNACDSAGLPLITLTAKEAYENAQLREQILEALSPAPDSAQAALSN